jgi:hypothetical protein
MHPVVCHIYVYNGGQSTQQYSWEKNKKTKNKIDTFVAALKLDAIQELGLVSLYT